MNGLPNGWTTCELAELGEMVGGKTPSKAEPRFWANGTVPWVSPKDMKVFELASSEDQITDEAISFGGMNLLPTDSILMVTRSGILAHTFPVAITQQPVTINQDIKAIPPSPAFYTRYLAYSLRSQEQTILSKCAKSGTTVASVETVRLQKLPLPLAPLPEQRRIADKLDATLARVDACRDRLARIAPLLKRFRQSVLAAATSGRLTEDWREQQAGQSTDCKSVDDRSAVASAPPVGWADAGSPTIASGDGERWASQAQPNLRDRPPIRTAIQLLDEIAASHAQAKIRVRGGAIKPSLEDLHIDLDLPTNWAVCGFDAIAEAVPNALKAGPFGSALKKDMYVQNGYKIYGQEQVISGDEDFGDYFIDQAKFDDLASCVVKPGDLLISLVGTIGRVLILSPKCKPGIINPRLVKLSLFGSISREFISIYLRGNLAQRFFEGKSHGGTMDILNLGILRELPILLPPVEEQHEIVRRVETLFAFADRLEARLANAQTAADRLTPALLAKAFRGELVPQDPKDEPASALLQRLAAQRASEPKPKRGRKAAGV